MNPPNASPAGFPEHEFAPAPDVAEAYTNRILIGRTRMSISNVIVAALARDIAPSFQTFTRTADDIVGMFGDGAIVVEESDSEDGTKNLLLEWFMQGPCKRSCSSVNFGYPRWPSKRSTQRGKQMAEYRERLRMLSIKMADRCKFHDDHTFVIVMDSDLAAYSLDGIANTIGWNGWDAVGSLGLKKHSKGHWINYDAWAWHEVGQEEPASWQQVNKKIWPRGAPLMPVWSCFGGLMVYRLAAFKSAQYVGDFGGDHYRFHFGMREAGFGAIYCNPSQLTIY